MYMYTCYVAFCSYRYQYVLVSYVIWPLLLRPSGCHSPSGYTILSVGKSVGKRRVTTEATNNSLELGRCFVEYVDMALRCPVTRAIGG